jgi:hypothetical protein
VKNAKKPAEAPESRRPARPDDGLTVDSVEMSSSGARDAGKCDPAFSTRILAALPRALPRLADQARQLDPDFYARFYRSEALGRQDADTLTTPPRSE